MYRQITRMRRLAVVVLALAILAPDRPAPAAAVTARVRTPRLVVIIAVDGLSWDRLTAWRPWLTAGLKRLLDEGAVASDCRYPHLNTMTAPGHASLATGAPPRVHGIPANEWFVPAATRGAMETVYSASQPQPGSPQGASSTPGPGRLRVASLGDRLVQRDPHAKVVAISNKDRSAIFLAGRDPRHAVYWYAEGVGTYVTSVAYDKASFATLQVEPVVARFNREKAGPSLAGRFGTIWSRPPAPDPGPVFPRDLAAQQDPYVGATFPHDLAKARVPLLSAILSSPFADRLLSDLALDLLADDALALGRDDVPDVLAVSFSANDYLSHDYGPESLEAFEGIRSLDVEIGRLLDDLTRRFGAGSVLVALSADHGFLPLTEAAKHRVSRKQIFDQLNAAVDARLGRTKAPRLIEAYEGCSLWLDRAALATAGAPAPKRVLEIVRHELATTWGEFVARTFLEEGSLPRQARNSYVPGRSGDLFVIPRSGVLIGPDVLLGTSHGSPWEYDTHVPLIFWGGGVKPRVLTSPTTPYDLAPTLASWLGVELPDATGTRLPLWK